MRRLLEAAAAASRARAEAHQITLQVDAPDTPASLDPMRVRQVLDNLIDNALRHTPPGGTITLTAYATGGPIEISVRDTGSGFTSPGRPVCGMSAPTPHEPDIRIRVVRGKIGFSDGSIVHDDLPAPRG